MLLTDVDGLYTAPPDHPGSQLIERVAGVDDLMSVLVTGAGSRVGTGGMATKVQAAMLATASGIGVQLASANDLQAVLEGTHVGTWFEPSAQRPASRRLWIAHVAPSRGEIIVDEGAARAITEGKKSLLVAGVHSVLGHFEAGGRGRRGEPDRADCARCVRLRLGHPRRGCGCRHGAAGSSRLRAPQARHSPRRPCGVGRRIFCDGCGLTRSECHSCDMMCEWILLQTFPR